MIDDIDPESVVPDSFDDFCIRFEELMAEAGKFGVDALWVLRQHDRFDLSMAEEAKSDAGRTNGVQYSKMGYSGGSILGMGLTVYAQSRFKSNWEADGDSE